MGIPDVNLAVNCNKCFFPLCPKCGRHRSVGIFLLTYVLDLCIMSEDTDLREHIFWRHSSEYDIRGHRSEEICFCKDIDLGVTSEDTDLRGQGFGRTWIWVWCNDWTRIWGKDMDLSLTYIHVHITRLKNA